MYNYTMKELKNEIYEYIANHKYASQNEIAEDLNIKSGLDIMTVLSELHKDGFINLEPIPLSLNNSNSVRYIVSGKVYKKEV